MAEKKGKTGKKGKKGKEIMDESTGKILRLYRRKCESNEVAVPNKFFREKVDEVIENNEDLTKVELNLILDFSVAYVR